MLNLKNYYYNKKRDKKHDRKSMREKAWHKSMREKAW
jgi:hypothetical protein